MANLGKPGAARQTPGFPPAPSSVAMPSAANTAAAIAPCAERAREAVVHQRRDEDARDDRCAPLEARGEEEREKLCLVTDFGQGDDAGGDEEGFQSGSGRAPATVGPA